jgi:hypothetical protein
MSVEHAIDHANTAEYYTCASTVLHALAPAIPSPKTVEAISWTTYRINDLGLMISYEWLKHGFICAITEMTFDDSPSEFFLRTIKETEGHDNPVFFVGGILNANDYQHVIGVTEILKRPHAKTKASIIDTFSKKPNLKRIVPLTFLDRHTDKHVFTDDESEPRAIALCAQWLMPFMEDQRYYQEIFPKLRLFRDRCLTRRSELLDELKYMINCRQEFQNEIWSLLGSRTKRAFRNSRLVWDTSLINKDPIMVNLENQFIEEMSQFQTQQAEN